MSVLYKALQKAEKENELRQSSSDASLDTRGLAASGALRFAGSRAAGANRTAMAAIVVVAVAGAGAFLFFRPSFSPQVAQVQAPPVSPSAPAPMMQPPSPEVSPATAEAIAPTADTPPVASADAELAPAPAPASSPTTPAPVSPAPEVVAAPSSPVEQAVSAPPPDAAPATQTAAVTATTSVTPQPSAPPSAPSAPSPAQTQVAANPPVTARAATPRAQERPEPMPAIPATSPARMLNPPIAINRSEFALAGVGNQVQVREVSQIARNNVAAGYDALVRGSYDTALGFYDKALVDEPNSILALLGRGAALQKLGRGQEAQISYDQVLKLDPQNREALTNITAILADRSPQDALARLLQLEQEYPNFSPVKAQIGLTYAKAGTMQQALDYLRRAVALNPESVMYQYNLALVLDHMGLRDQAIGTYQTVLTSLAGGRGSPELSAADIERRVRFLRSR